MKGLTIIIPSRNETNIKACLEAISRNEPHARVLVIWNGEHKAMFPLWTWGTEHLLIQVDWYDDTDQEKFNFSAAVNRGIKQEYARSNRDMVIMNDDAILETWCGLTRLQYVHWNNPLEKLGIVAASCNNVGETEQFPQASGFEYRIAPRMVCFVCVYIPRSTIETVGNLDERYVDYGCEDDDYCKRVKLAGMNLAVSDLCFVDHSKLESEFRGHGQGDFRPNLRRYIQKWGTDNWGRTRNESHFPGLFDE